MDPIEEQDDILEINEDDIQEIIYPDIETDGLHEGMEDLDVDDGGISHEDIEVERNDAAAVFDRHNGSVFSVDINPADQSQAVSGGEDDVGYIWNRNDPSHAEIKLDGHKDSVVKAQYSYDGKYIMTADMSGIILIWRSVNGSNVCRLECGDIEWANWHPGSAVVLAGTSDGEAYMWKVPGGDCKICPSHGRRTTCGFILPSGKQLYVGYDDGSLKLWDLRTTACIFHFSGEMGHTDAVTCVASSKSGALLASGSEDGTVRVYNTASGKLIAFFNSNNKEDMKEGTNDKEEGASPHGVECVGFSYDQQFLCCGYLSGSFLVWDLSSQRLRHSCAHPDGISRVLFMDKLPECAVTGCLDGNIRIWNLKSGTLKNEFHGHSDSILDLSYSKIGNVLISGSDDHTARIFKIPNAND